MRLLLLLVVVGTASALAPLLRTENSVPDRYIVKLKDDADLERVLKKVEFAAALDKFTKVTHTFTHVFNGFSARLTNELVETIRNLDVVEYVEEDSIMKVAEVASWGLDRVDQIVLPLDDSYFPIGDGTGVHVYVLDTGINEFHEDFGGRAHNDHDTVGDGQEGVDCDGHGTHCSGTVGGTSFGVAKAAHISGIRVLDCSGSGYTSGIVAGCDWVIANGTRPAVGSMSLGGSASSTLDAGVQAMIDSGIQVAVAAGNEDTNACNKSPARVSEAITVGATDINDARAYFSNYGTCVDIFAPGVSITSSWIGSSNNVNNTISGTSMATPHVAGAAAILLGINNNQSPLEIKENLQTKSIADAVTDEQPGSPNLLLYIGEGSGGGSVPPPPPTSTPCGTQITDNGTLLTSPNYPNQYDNNAQCQYTVDAPTSNLAVGIIFSYFNVESHSTCDYDALKIHDGNSSSDPLIAILCGESIPSPVYSSGQSMYLEFTSDNIIKKPGFSANVFFYDAATVPTNAPIPVVNTTVPPITVQPPSSAPCSTSGPITTSGANVTSPGWPNSYGNNIDCYTQIQASDGQAVMLSLSNFSLEYSSTCNYDKLVIYDGDSSSSEEIGVYCGSTIPGPVYSSGPSMLLEFTTDGSVTDQGYFGTVTFIDESEVPTPPPPPTTGCGSRKTDPSGNITTPGYPSQYNSNVDCTTHIHSEDAAKTVTLTFNAFDVEDQTTCSYDYVSVYDGENDSATELGKFCGTTIPPPVSSSGPDMFVKFSSDSSVPGYGVHASYVIS